jgi:hypothetical protein
MGQFSDSGTGILDHLSSVCHQDSPGSGDKISPSRQLAGRRSGALVCPLAAEEWLRETDDGEIRDLNVV